MNYEEAKMDIVYFEGDVFTDDGLVLSTGSGGTVNGGGLFSTGGTDQ